MPHFCHCGSDTYICQVCATVACGNPACREYRYSEWVKGKGNVCASCVDRLASAVANRQAFGT